MLLPSFPCRLSGLLRGLLLSLCFLPALVALDIPPELGPGLTPTADSRSDYTVTQVAPVLKGFKAPTKIKVAFQLPDAELVPGKLYLAQVTWTAGEQFHLNGELPGHPDTPYCTLRLTGPQIESGPVSFTGSLQAAEFPEIAPYYHERTVTATLPFRISRAATQVAAKTVAAQLEVDSAYCSDADGSCFTDIVTPLGGQRYAVTFRLAATRPPEQDEPFPAPRIPPLTPFGSAPSADPPADNPPPTPLAPPTGSEPPVGASSPPAAAEPEGVWDILWSDREADLKVRALYDHGGLLMLLLFVGLSGVLTTALPCTYPLIPITARILGARAANRQPQPGDPTRGDAFAASLFYLFGLTLIYGLIGGLGASASLLITDINNAVWFNLSIAALFGVLALGMFGLFEIKMPSFIANKLQGGPPGAERKHGLFSNGLRGFTMGILAAVLAGACTAPVIFAAVLLIGKLELGFVKGFTILAPFGFGFGLPYFLLTNFVSRLPAPGQWMELVKIAFGTVILLAGFYFWDKTVPNPALYSMALGVALLAVGIGFGALDRLEAPVPAAKRVRQLTTVGLTIVGGYFLVAGLHQSFAGDSPVANPNGASTANAIAWESYQTYDPDRPDGSGRPVFIFFHSPSCYYCNKMLATAFKDPEVIALTRQIRMIDADAHYTTDQLIALQERYGYFSQPHSVFLDAQHRQSWGEAALVRGYIDTPGVKQRFQKLLQKP